eukprot:TRINITY_DN9423_c0_g1_i1.p1 TRINITY_DN9423_c0_g1~~TRINITY_DN9423_c0_g1_i1.p1  ORF type:complete len:109 (-),score=2.48 TRINITY_DN9423_c0_g1_i1:119-445(-)
MLSQFSRQCNEPQVPESCSFTFHFHRGFLPRDMLDETYTRTVHGAGRSTQLDLSEKDHASASAECQFVDKTNSVSVNPHLVFVWSALLLTDSLLTLSANLRMRLHTCV